MIRQFSTNLRLQLEQELELITREVKDPVLKMTSSIKPIKENLNELRAYIEKHPFSDVNEEIYFFKHIKPEFYSKLIYHVECYKIDNAKPCGILEKVKKYYEKELIFIERFFYQNKFLYEYYRHRMVELDSIYFVRGAEIQTVISSETTDMQTDFSTGCDYLFSKFIAYESLQTYILTEIGKIQSSGISVPEDKKEVSELKWTGDKVNLVEVIYGIYFTGQLNHGNADLSVIIRFMEKSLQIDLSRSYRDFIDIRNRKRSSPTRYIEEMRESISKKVDDDLALKRPKRTTVKTDLK